MCDQALQPVARPGALLGALAEVLVLIGGLFGVASAPGPVVPERAAWRGAVGPLHVIVASRDVHRPRTQNAQRLGRQHNTAEPPVEEADGPTVCAAQLAMQQRCGKRLAVPEALAAKQLSVGSG